MADSLFRVEAGITTGSYRATAVERFSASSISHRALVSVATILLRRSSRSISYDFLSGGKGRHQDSHDDSRLAKSQTVT
jgi:hypothetical protein